MAIVFSRNYPRCSRLGRSCKPTRSLILRELSLLTKSNSLPRKELNLDPSSTFSLVSKWGPSARTVVRIAASSGVARMQIEKGEENKAHQAAYDICHAPSLRGSLLSRGVPSSEGSSIRFVRPYRRSVEGTNTNIIWADAISFIPTKFLDKIFTTHCQRFSNDKSFELFEVFSSHSLTRTTAGWTYEKLVHHRLCSNGAPFNIFSPDSTSQMQMRPSTHLIPGTATGLGTIGVSDSFYWMPSVMDVTGVDGVLGDTNGNLFAVQMTTISDTLETPAAGLRQIWSYLRPDVRLGRTWNVVLVTDQGEAAAGRLARECPKQLRGFTLGPGIRVLVWGCFIPSN